MTSDGGGAGRVRLFIRADEWQRRGAAALQALHQGWWLGWLDHRDLDDLARRQYARWPRYRDDTYNTSGLTRWEADAVRAHFPAEGAILVAAAGGGREVVALARLGYRVEGFDCVEALVACGRETLMRFGVNARLELAPPGGIPEGLGHHVGAIVGWGGYMHIPGRGARIAFLRGLRRHVDAGAPLLVSFFTRTGPSRRLVWTQRIARALRRLRRSPDPVEYGDTLDRTFDHLFTEDEIAQEMKAADFALVSYAETPYGHAVGRAV